MKKLIYLAAALILFSTVGCANGPIRNWLRGAPCNTCQPPFHAISGTGALGACTTGCGTNSAIPNPIIQSAPGQAAISGPIIETGPRGQPYYSNGDPTTQGYGIQPGQQIFQNGLNPPNGGPTPQPNIGF